MILADKLLVLRTTAGLSQEELAEKLNVSRQSVSKWDAGVIIETKIKTVYGLS